MARSPILAAALIIAAASAADAQQRGGEQVIVVTAQRIEDTERALRECIARRCPTLEDIAATLAHAENQFVAGDYESARRTLLLSQRRNRRAAAEHPVPVSLLYRASSRIARHMGETEEQERAATGLISALRAGLPRDDPQMLVGMFDLADAYRNIGRHHAALRQYDTIARRARAAGQPVLAGHAELRGAWLLHAMGGTRAARDRLDALAAETDPRLRTIAIGARILVARIGHAEGDSRALDSVVAELSRSEFRRTLIHAPPIQPPRLLYVSGRETSGAALSGDPWHFSEPETHRETWVEIGFRVAADGRVEDAEILRAQGPTGWTRPVLASVSGRVYTPSAGGEEDYRVERFSLTSPKIDVTGTRFRRHSDAWRIEQIDLSSN